jgi:hypothetical protein
VRITYVGIPGPHATEGTREKGMYGNTALHLAAASPQMEIRKQLMELCPESKKALSDDGQTSTRCRVRPESEADDYCSLAQYPKSALPPTFLQPAPRTMLRGGIGGQR